MPLHCDSAPRPYAPAAAAVVRLRSKVLTAEDVRGVRAEFTRLARRASACELLLDFYSVEASTAGGLGQLVALHRGLLAAGGALVLFNVGPSAHRVFELTRLTRVLDVRPAAGASVEGAPS